jgi:hypothetical protein
MNSSSASHGRSTPDCELNDTRNWSVAVFVGGVAKPDATVDRARPSWDPACRG